MNGNSHILCNQNQIYKNLPLKKRPTYLIDHLLENDNSSKLTNIVPVPIPIPVAPTPPLSPHIDLLRQQKPSLQQQQYGYIISEDDQQKIDLTIDEHFRKSLGGYYNRCLTPDETTNEQTPVDSIEEHFARSLAKFRLINSNDISIINHQLTESVVDDHFAKALGSTIWQKLKEK